MAAAEIIGAAVGVMLLVIVAYVVIGSTLYAAETVTTAQKDLTIQQETRMRTSISITDPVINGSIIHANITNTGTEIIGDFKHTDVIVYDSTLTASPYQIYPYATGEPVTTGRWGIENPYNEILHPYELDPGETYLIRVNTEGSSPGWFQITTGNGVSASTFI
jgi:archaeal flagellar protein FlaF